MPIPAGILRETVVIESQSETRNSLGESTSTWSEFAKRRASVESISYSEQERAKQVGGAVSWTVRCRWVDGVLGNMRVRWASRGGKLLYISSVVERGVRDELELLCSERAT